MSLVTIVNKIRLRKMTPCSVLTQALEVLLFPEERESCCQCLLSDVRIKEGTGFCCEEQDCAWAPSLGISEVSAVCPSFRNIWLGFPKRSWGLQGTTGVCDTFVTCKGKWCILQTHSWTDRCQVRPMNGARVQRRLFAAFCVNRQWWVVTWVGKRLNEVREG